MDNYKIIGQRIKKERETLKLTQKELAERAGIDFRFLGNIERGVSKPSLDTIVSIAQAIDMPLDLLVAEHILHKNPPENSAITKEVVRLMKMLTDTDAKRILKLIRCAIELYTGKPIVIPNEIRSKLKDERTTFKRTINIRRRLKKRPHTEVKVKEKTKKKKKETGGLTRFWLINRRKNRGVRPYSKFEEKYGNIIHNNKERNKQKIIHENHPKSKSKNILKPKRKRAIRRYWLV